MSMRQEDKELLLKDLCARLPYGVKAKYYGSAEECECCDTIEGIYPMDDEIVIGQYGLSVDMIKPYLFPLSSMTEKQKEELKYEISKQTEILIERMKNDDCGIDCGKYYFNSIFELKWLLKNHFDIYGLIPMGSAIDATGLNIY